MANVNHSALSDPYLHEPKGASTANAGEVYIANGAGSGSWTELSRYVNGFVDFNAVSPYAYQHSVTTSYTALNPAFSLEASNGFSAASSPNARLVYNGTETIKCSVNFTFNFKNDSGSNKDLEVVFYQNGTVMNGGHIIVSAISGSWSSATLTDFATLATNDYVEVFVKGSGAFTLDVASATLTIVGAPN
eukprot:GHVU01233533.1.p1 GENE.GHVU01233533.1~~GHVU01233533.1.p1  ORF type:complete len:190 (-),score=6.81 GHVU01233533.1:114-683(-)